MHAFGELPGRRKPGCGHCDKLRQGFLADVWPFRLIFHQVNGQFQGRRAGKEAMQGIDPNPLFAPIVVDALTLHGRRRPHGLIIGESAAVEHSLAGLPDAVREAHGRA